MESVEVLVDIGAEVRSIVECTLDMSPDPELREMGDTFDPLLEFEDDLVGDFEVVCFDLLPSSVAFALAFATDLALLPTSAPTLEHDHGINMTYWLRNQLWTRGKVSLIIRAISAFSSLFGLGFFWRYCSR